MNTKTVSAAAVILLAGTAASATLQHHPFSQLFPPNEDLDIGGKDILGASVVETGTLRANGTGSGDLSLATSGNTDFLRWDDSDSVLEIPNSDLKMSGNRIQNLSDPVEAQDATTKSYVDTSDDTVSDDQTLSDVLSRGNSSGSNGIDMSGNQITNLQDPDSAQDAATQGWVNSNDDYEADNQALSDVLTAGNKANMSINMSGNQIENVNTPDESDDVATKGYVDNNTGSVSCTVNLGSESGYSMSYQGSYSYHYEAHCPSGEVQTGATEASGKGCGECIVYCKPISVSCS